MASFIYSDKYYLDWPDHIFPGNKYKLIYDQLIAKKVITAKKIIAPRPATENEVTLVHSPGYLALLRSIAAQNPFLGLSGFEVPIYKQVLEAFYLATGGTIMACRLALKKKSGVMNISGGFHHAFPEHGEGFCLINDLAVAIRVLQKEKLVKKTAVIDCDLHQGNGTAYIFQNDPAAFTFSIHQENNYPIKQKSSLDIGLPDFVGDKEYLKALYEHIPAIIKKHQPDLILYQAGADPYEGDQLGALKLTKAGLAQRDRFIFQSACQAGIPIAVTLGGGYALNIQDVVDIHCQTARILKEIYSKSI
jgi:acetoin utilization deacetylase AcuC-like enzyme